MIRSWLSAMAAAYCIVGLLAMTPSVAQEPATLPAALPTALTAAEIDAFVARLGDDGVRQLFIAQLLQAQEELEAADTQAQSSEHRQRACSLGTWTVD